MQSYLYTAQRGRLTNSIKDLSCYNVHFIFGCLKARNPAEAYTNARLLVKERGGNVTQLIVSRL
jgi:GTP cyclohydrolase III